VELWGEVAVHSRDTSADKIWQVVDHGWPVRSLHAASSEIYGPLDQPIYRYGSRHHLVLVVTTDGAPAITCRDERNKRLIIGPWDTDQRFWRKQGRTREQIAEDLIPGYNGREEPTLSTIVGRIEPPISNAIRAYFHIGELSQCQTQARNPHHPLGELWVDELRSREPAIEAVPQLLRPHLAKAIVANT
jgi:hypothetical protein